MEGDRRRHADRLWSSDGNDAPEAAQSEAVANGDGPALGRELEIAELLRFIKRDEHPEHGLADGRRPLLRGALLRPRQGAVPGLRAVLGIRRRPAERRHVRPERAGQDLRPPTDVRKAPPEGQSNLPPSAGLQFFGQVDISEEGIMLVSLKDLEGQTLYTKELLPAA